MRGIDDSVVTPREVQKQVSREETFGRDLHDDDLIERELLRLAVRVSTDRVGLAERPVVSASKLNVSGMPEQRRASTPSGALIAA